MPHVDAVANADPPERPNAIYYFGIGVGEWRGSFRMRITNWKAFLCDPIGIKYRFLTLWLVAMLDLFGPAPIRSRLTGDATAGDAGVVTNAVKISRFRIPVYVLNERYV